MFVMKQHLLQPEKIRHVVEKQDFLDAVDRIVGGLERKTKIISPDEKKDNCIS